MGKQIRFYISNDSKMEFINYVFSLGYRVFSEKYFPNTGSQCIEHIDNDTIDDWHLIFYKDSYGKLCYNENQYNRVDVVHSPVVEFMDTIIHNKGNYISDGRIWISNKNVFDGKCARECFISDYTKLVKWIKKNIPRQEYFNGKQVLKGYIDDELKDIYEHKYRLI